MVLTSAIRPNAPFPALSEHRQLRFATIFLLYVAQGLPFGFFQFAVPAWLAANGASAAQIGTVVGASVLPWSLKLVHGFIMDRWAYLPMGRRRAWVIIAQLMIIVSLLALAVAAPEPQDILLLAALGFLANLFTTVQDVAIDGMAIDLIPDAERGRCNGLMFGGQALGIGVGTSLGGATLASSGTTLAALVVAPVVAALLLLVLFIRERPGERLMPWSPGAASPEARAMHVGAWKPVVMGVLQAMATRPALLFLLGSFLAAVGGGIGLGLIPLLGARELGWDSDRISSVSSTGNIVAAIAAVLLIGLIADRIGAKRCSMLMCGLAAALALAMLAARGHWHLPAVFMTFAILYLVLDVAISTCTCALAMRICVPAVGATQFSLFMAGANLGISAGAAMLGTLQAWGDLTAMMIGVAAAQIAAILCLMAARVGR